MPLANKRDEVVKLLRGEMLAFIYCDLAMDVPQAIKLVNDYKLKGVLVLNEDCHKAISQIAAAKLPVVLDPNLVYWETDPRTGEDKQIVLPKIYREAGVPVVTIGMGGWDHHGNLNGVRGTIFERSAEQLPYYDRSIHALVTDLHQRGLDRDVTVVVWGEFGRTPRVNRYGGRDHWTPAGFSLFACGGLHTGQTVGATDDRG